MTRRQSHQDRKGAALIEMALVAVLFFMFLFGILEYCRLVFIRQVLTNAAREGARYAVTNVYLTNVETSTQNYVKARLGGFDKKTSYYKCDVYLSDSNGTKIGAAGDAAFGQLIAVHIEYDYTPVLPSLLRMSSTLRLKSRSLMYSEAN